ncbi:hypothetical protein PspLS_03336 [Pyricularia sp. CBS 133598]|nr:hypothetical protein PspLS_03336 [Pyricularia sp. CBS 133598]
MKLLLVSGWAALALLFQAAYGHPISVTGYDSDQDVLHLGSGQQHAVSKRGESNPLRPSVTNTSPKRKAPFSLSLGKALEEEYAANARVGRKFTGKKLADWNAWVAYKPSADKTARRTRKKAFRANGARLSSPSESDSDVLLPDPFLPVGRKHTAPKGVANTRIKNLAGPQGRNSPDPSLPAANIHRLPSPSASDPDELVMSRRQQVAGSR